MFKHILCATDASDDADRALDYAAAIASQSDGELHIVHVVEKLVSGKIAGQNADFFEQDHAIKLRHQCTKLGDRGIDVTLHTPYAKIGAVAHCVVDIAKDNDVDLIVAGTRGRSALAGAVLGSVAQGLLHTSTCPVLAVPHHCVATAEATSDTLASAG
jgi:nucleotide-binding universal stress UspA family protein